MRPLGLIGGTSWRSTSHYYGYINTAVNAHFGNNTNPPLFLANVDQAAVHRSQAKGDWDAVADLFTDAARRLEATGVEALMFCASTPHKVHDRVAREVSVPFLHIGDAIGRALRGRGVSTAGFIGTRFSMESPFVTQRIGAECGRVLVPQGDTVLEELQRIVRDELSMGRRVQSSVDYVVDVLEALVDRGAEGVVLGCTEFPAMLAGVDRGIRTFDALELHAQAAVEFVLGEGKG